MSDRQQLLKRIQELSFTLDDLQLYLNMHPCDEDALRAFNSTADLEQEATEAYECAYGPLSAANAQEDEHWAWVREAWPWEKEG